MGTILSSRKDYNRVLAKQPRDPIILSKFEFAQDVKQHPLVGTLSIPDPVRYSSKKKPPDTLNSLPQPAVEPVASKPPSPTVENQTEEQVIARDPPYSSRLSLQMNDQQINNDAVVLSRSVINLNDQRRFNNNQFSSFRPNRTVVERNGKQFLSEFKERMEQRYVRVLDDTTGRMRTFEVTDYIPSRTVRPMKIPSQFQPQPRTLRYGLHQRPILPTILNRVAQPATPSNLLNFKDLNDRKIVEREFALHQIGASLPSNNNNNVVPAAVPPSQPQLTTQASTDSAYTYPDPTSIHVYNPPTTSSQRGNNASTISSEQTHNASTAVPRRPYNSIPVPSQNEYNIPDNSPQHTYNASTVASRHAYDQYSPGSYRSRTTSFRPHSPTASTYSSSSSVANSIHSQDESDTGTLRLRSKPYVQRNDNGRNNADVSYGAVSSEFHSLASLDPFAKPVRSSDHRYTRRSHANQYSQPLSKKQGYQANSALDYTPISMAQNRPNQRQPLHNDSDAYNG